MYQRNDNRALKEALCVLFALPLTVVVGILGLIFDRDEPLTYTPPSVEQDATLEPYTVALPVAIPATPDDLPTAELAPVLALAYTPAEATPAPKSARRAPKGRKAATVILAKKQAMPSAARATADPMAAAMRRVCRGEAVRAAARAEGVSESSLRGRLKRAAK